MVHDSSPNVFEVYRNFDCAADFFRLGNDCLGHEGMRMWGLGDEFWKMYCIVEGGKSMFRAYELAKMDFCEGLEMEKACNWCKF